MSNDHFIARMMDETFETVQSKHTSDDFQLRRELSRLGVKYFVGEWSHPHIARFSANGSELDLPVEHKLLRWTDAKPLAQAMSSWIGESLSDVLVLTSQDNRPWILMWNKKEQMVNLNELRFLFQATQKAA